MTSQVFGPLLSATQVEVAVQDTLKLWMPTYLTEIEKQTSRAVNALPKVRAYSRSAAFLQWPEDQLPHVLTICPGLHQEPVKNGEGRYRARWTVGIAAVVSARDQASTNDLARDYGTAIRGCILQHASLGGKAIGVHWLDEKFDDIPVGDERSIAAAQEIFWVEFENVIGVKTGPSVPDGVHPVDWPTVQTANVTIQSVDIDDD